MAIYGPIVAHIWHQNLGMAQVACEFADLHDRAGRMKAVGAVRESAFAGGWGEMEGGGKPMDYRIVPVCWFGLVFNNI